MIRAELLKPAILAPLAAAMIACSSFKVEGGEKPIVVDLNVNVSGEVLVKLQQEIDSAIVANPDIF